MSSWNIGANDVTEEAQAIKDRLASKDAHISAQQSQLMKQTEELNELKATLNETLHKLGHETERAIQLETNFKRCSEDLRSEKIRSQNVETALTAAQDVIKEKDLEIRELHAALDSLSHKSEDSSALGSKLEREKGMLEARVKELESELRQRPAAPLPASRLRAPRSRSSSVSNFQLSTLEQDLNDVRVTLANKESDLRTATQKLKNVQDELIKVSNEKAGMEKKMQSQLQDMEASLEEKEEELQFLKEQQGDATREEALLKRIDEDEAKITALETMLRNTAETDSLRETLVKAETKLRLEVERASESEARQIELVREKEEALDELEESQARVTQLSKLMQEKEARVEALEAKERDLTNQVRATLTASSTETLLIQPPLVPPPDDAAVAYIERLLAAIDRLRGERDNLRRDLQFLETESKFAIEALEAKVAASSVPIVQEDPTVLEELQTLRTRVHEAHTREETMVRTMKQQNSRVSLATLASAVVIGHLQSRVDTTSAALLSLSDKFEAVTSCLHDKEQAYVQLGVDRDTAVLRLAEVTAQKSDLTVQLDAQNAEVERLTQACIDLQDALHQTEAHLGDIGKSLEDVESERNSLTLQVTNLLTDIESSQQELAEAESRYSTLQMHQLSTMSSNEVTRALRQQIEELEDRVMRRTEQIGIHQHDIKRLETNMRLQEDRLSEMTMELETVAAEKSAMVEDCAAAREARDEALVRVEGLEVDFELLEQRMEERDIEVAALVVVIVETVGRSRSAVKSLTQRIDENTAEINFAVAHMSEERQVVDMENQRMLHLLEQTTLALQDLQQSTHSSETSERQAILALAVSRQDAFKLSAVIRTAGATTTRLQEQVEVLRTELGAREVETKALVLDFETKVQDFQGIVAANETCHNETVKELTSSKAALQLRIEELDHLLARNDLQGDMEHLKAEHVEELKELQGRLEHLTTALEEARDRYIAAEACHEEALSESTRSKQDLEERQAEYEARLGKVTEQSSLTQRQLEDEIVVVQSKLKEHVDKIENFEETVAQLESKLREQDDLRSLEKQTHEEKMDVATRRYECAESALVQLREDLAAVETQLDEARRETKTLQDEKTSLQEEMTTLGAEIQRSLSLTRFLESQAKDSARSITSLSDTLERTRADLSRSEESGQAAEVSLSLQTAQHKREMADLQKELAALRSKPDLQGIVAELEERNNEMEELLRSKCAEIEENDDRVIEMLKEKKKLATKVESLTRKVQNLQTKLAAAKASLPTSAPSEPAANPSMVSSSSSAIAPTPLARTTTITHVPPIPPIPVYTHSTPLSRTPSTLSRVASTSSLTRAKTPERRIAPPPVFKTRTPEKSKHPVPTAMPDFSSSVSSSGSRKRRAPDDFEDCDGVPPQAFTADSLPSEDVENTNTTPRVRRVLQSIHSGFTPVRTRPNVPMPSPKRRSTAAAKPLIADLTNNPLAPSQGMASEISEDSKQSKRSWLGRIRGASTQTQAGRAGSRPVFERADS